MGVMRKRTKGIIVVAYLFDVLSIVFLTRVLAWWKETHMYPGLSAMLHVDLIFKALITAVLGFMVMTVWLSGRYIRKRYSKKL